MLIGVISDTHDNLLKVDAAVKVLNDANVEKVIHCGDFVAPFVIKRLSALKAQLIGVFGNNDGDKPLLLKFSRKYNFTLDSPPAELELAGRKILVLHGFGSKELTKRIVYAIAEKGEYDVILYGHTHEPEVSKVGRTLVVNPGEVFGMLTGKSTLALVDLEKLEAKLVEL